MTLNSAKSMGVFRSVRTFFTSAARRGGHDHHDIGGVPGSNLSFGIDNRHKLAVYFGLWFGSGFSVPFLLLRHQMTKKNQHWGEPAAIQEKEIEVAESQKCK